jgi:hypothetical protein
MAIPFFHLQNPFVGFASRFFFGRYIAKIRQKNLKNTLIMC